MGQSEGDETKAGRLRRRNRAVTLRMAVERLPVLVGAVLVMGIGGLSPIYQTGGTLEIGRGPERRAAEERELVSSGDCALKNGEPVGRINGVLTRTRAVPERKYQVEVIERKRVLQIFAGEVTVVPCASLEVQPWMAQRWSAPPPDRDGNGR